MINGLTSLRAVWDEAFARVGFEKPGATFVDTLERGLDGPLGAMLDTHANFSLGCALRLLLLDEDPQHAVRLLAAMNRNRERMLAELLRADTDPGLLPAQAIVWLAAASTMQDAAAPDRTLLTLVARTIAERLEASSKRKHLHVAALFRLQFAAYAALLSGDLALLRRVLAVRKTVAIIPQQWSMLQLIAKTAKEQPLAGVGVLRCEDPEVHRQFMQMFQLHRHPSNRHVAAEMGEESLLAGGQLGGYVYAWIYLQTFAPQPTLHSDWATLRELLIG